MADLILWFLKIMKAANFGKICSTPTKLRFSKNHNKGKIQG